MFTADNVLIGCYLAILLALSVYGFHRSMLVWMYLSNRKNTPQPKRQYALDELPRVTVQLPLFNEMYVAQRLLESVASIDYPKLQIQVLDDSTDETKRICEEKCAELRARGVDIEYVHRAGAERTGFKAGALANGLKTATGELILIFDADFLPRADVLHQMVHFFTDDKIGMVQARWDHVNRDYSLLTEMQALMLDGHFVIEHTARHRGGKFFNFNGTAGIWRRTAIDDAGGWSHDTLTEDMDLSYRAQLKGWQFVYLRDVVTPAELPVEMNSFKSQQFRWAKGSVQVAKKLLPAIWRSKVPFATKLEAFFHLTNNFAYPLLMLLCLMVMPTLLVRGRHGWKEVLIIDMPLFFGTVVSIASFYLTSQREIRADWRKTIRKLPMMMSLGIGLCVNQTRAVLEALFGGTSGEFVRTPKHGVVKKFEGWTAKKYRASKTVVPYIEVLFALYFIAGFVVAGFAGHYVSMPFLMLFFMGFGYVGFLSLHQAR